jgi:hypothetical protein
LDSSLVGEAVTHLGVTLHPQVYNHSVRTFLLGREAARRDGVADLDVESLCMQHCSTMPGQPNRITDLRGSKSRAPMQPPPFCCNADGTLRWSATAPSWVADLLRHHQPGINAVNPAF